MAKRRKRLTILHSNDMHGDFFPENKDGREVGGVSMLSDYLDKVRMEKTPSIYCIAGDMLQGALIDNEYKGLSTIDIINLLQPDVASLGNHEVDYGLAHLMFLERCAKFPIVNANIYSKVTGTRLFRPHMILERAGLRILFIGIITEEILNYKVDPLIETFVDLEDAVKSVGVICNSYKGIDVDLTVLLTHIGIDKDQQLAAALPKELGVDIIIGGHTHTFLEEPIVVNDILIVQAGCGTDYIGRFDLVLDTDRNCVDSYKWQMVPITNENCTKSRIMEDLLQTYTKKVGDKYNKVLRRLDRDYTHPDRFQETELGNLLADILRNQYSVDIFLLGSGAIRKEVLPAIVTRMNLREAFPYENKVYCIWVDGATLRRMMLNFFRAFTSGKTREFYQLSRHFHVTYDREKDDLTRFIYWRKPVSDKKVYSVGIPDLHMALMEEVFGITLEELSKYKTPKIISTSTRETVEEFLNSDIPMRVTLQDRIRID